MLRATTVCSFSPSELSKVFQTRCVFTTLTWKSSSRHSRVQFLHVSTSKSAPSMKCLTMLTSASRHNGVQFFMSHLARWPCIRRFSELTFQASGASKHWKNTLLRDLSTFSRTLILFLLALSLLTLSLH